MHESLNVVGIIPARLESTRLPRKLTRKILNKSLLQWVWENASKARMIDKLVIAVDDEILATMAKDFGAEVIMTSPKHTSGTDRVSEAVITIDAKVIINIQADEPLMHPSVIDSLAQEMLGDLHLNMATVKKRIDNFEEVNNSNVVKVVCDEDDYALYFSRFPLPFYRDQEASQVYYKHLGIYAYTKDFLYTFKNMPASRLEQAEKLEQLRVLEAGYKIKVIETKFESCGVDTEEDLIKVEQILAEKK